MVLKEEFIMEVIDGIIPGAESLIARVLTYQGYIMYISSTFTAIHRFSAFQVSAIWVHFNYTCIFYLTCCPVFYHRVE